MALPKKMPRDIQDILDVHEGRILNWHWGYNSWRCGDGEESINASCVAGHVCLNYKIGVEIVCNWFFCMPVAKYHLQIQPGLRALCVRLAKKYKEVIADDDVQGTD